MVHALGIYMLAGLREGEKEIYYPHARPMFPNLLWGERPGGVAEKQPDCQRHRAVCNGMCPTGDMTAVVCCASPQKTIITPGPKGIQKVG